MSAACDLLVIGAGIHGAGVAQAAAAAGHSVLVLEQAGVAWATSCRSSKLIHGGLRYLESAQFGLVRESLREREILLRIAPGLVRRVAFYIPVYADTRRRPLTIRAGLSLYALLAGLHAQSGFRTLARVQWQELDGLETRGLESVFRYYDAQTDDAALTRAVLRSAQTLGAELLCPATFVSAQRDASGYVVRYRTPQGEAECRCRALVNAAGPWVNEVLTHVTPAPAQAAIELVQGTHLVFDGTLDHGVYYTEAEDGRAVFVMPWRGMTLVGTTETRYRGDPAAVRPLPEEIGYLTRTFRRYFPRRDAFVRDQFAGVRVLPNGNSHTFHRPRETLLMTDTAELTRLVSVVGGKLTGYRATAQKIMARLGAALPARRVRADTTTLPLTD